MLARRCSVARGRGLYRGGLLSRTQAASYWDTAAVLFEWLSEAVSGFPA